ncbi:hypothetical protein [Frateuria defendens]|uniref:hypothetical protein n=1 Tax=Frateuria defendens TaxID=2219559 RepID=UPI00066FCAE0|nr:hypothetical protein [Frateuria defendens]
MSPHLQTVLITAAVMALVVWRRARRLIGRQPIQRKRMTARIVILAVVVVMLGASGLHSPRLLEGLLGGAVLGVGLGLLGLRLSRFERGPDGADYYIPNPWLGGALVVLLVGRLAWRFMTMLPQGGQAGFDPAAPQGAPALGNSPLTLLVFGLLLGYYLAYYAGLLVHHRRFERLQAGPAA